MRANHAGGDRRGSPLKLLGLAGVVLAAFALAGCGRCGEAVKFNAPTFPKVCTDSGQPK